MRELVLAMLPEIVLCAAACVLLLMGTSNKPAVRRSAPALALLALLVAGITQLGPLLPRTHEMFDSRWHTVYVFEFARYVKMLSAGMGILLVMLAWPGNAQGTGGPALDWGTEAGEFFAMMLFSIAGVFIVAGANDIMLLFLGIELASIPTYIMVSISRPLEASQEAGVKYFFLGAMAAALMLFGFSYLYGTTGTTKLDQIMTMMGPVWHPWQAMAVVVLIAGFAFKMAVVPLHVYAGDVYEGAGTPVTAFLSFVPKITGFVALLKILYATTGGGWVVPPEIFKLLWVLAALTMTVGNVLGLVQVQNVKRTLAYSSIAHSGYMLVGVTALVFSADPDIQSAALQGILFYLAAYGLMNVGAFGVLILLPSRRRIRATSAETFDDLAGLGHKHLLLALAMSVSCFSLIGLPLTVGFFGKFYLIAPAFKAKLNWLVVILVLNAAISAAYYLRIVAALFLRTESPQTRFGLLPESPIPTRPIRHPIPVLVSVGVSMVGVLWLGIVLPATQRLTNRTVLAAQMERTTPP